MYRYAVQMRRSNVPDDWMTIGHSKTMKGAARLLEMFRKSSAVEYRMIRLTAWRGREGGFYKRRTGGYAAG